MVPNNSVIEARPSPRLSKTVRTSVEPPKRKHITELDGLRAVAVALVFLNHYAPVSAIAPLAFLRHVGWTGVDLFFVLSGFLITGILVDTRDSPRYFRDFYIRRSLRIFPLYYLTLTIALVWMAVTDGGAAYRQMVSQWGSPLWEYAYLGNIKTALSGASPAWILTPFWSLHVEEQFYLLFPFIVRLLSKRTLFKVLIALVVVAPLVRLGLWMYDPQNPQLQYALLPSRVDDLALGALIAVRMRLGAWVLPKRGLAIAGATLLAAACWWFVAGGSTFGSDMERTIGYSLFGASAAAVILWIVRFRGTWATNWLNLRPIQFLGRISYGLYALQIPVGVFFGWLTARLHWKIGQGTNGLLVAGLCVAAAAVSFYCFENPILGLKDRFAPLTFGDRSDRDEQESRAAAA